MNTSIARLSQPRHDLFTTMRVHRGLMELSRHNPDTYRALEELSKDRTVYALLDELDASPDLRERAAEDPMRFLDEHGIAVPPGFKVIVAPAARSTAKVKKDDRSWFIGIEDSGGLRWGYEGGPAGRGVVCGE